MTYRTNYKKYGNQKTTYNGYKYDSKFEAGVAKDLDIQLKAGEILAWDRQYKVEMWACDSKGMPQIKKSHKVDFRVHNLDGTYTLLEAKGFETQDYRDRRKWLERLWLPDHPDHDYRVVYNK